MTTLAVLSEHLERAVTECRASDLPTLVGILEAAKVKATARALSPAPPTSDVVDVTTLAAELDLAESWLRARVRAGELPHIRAGKHIRFRRSEVLAALEHRIPTPARAEKAAANGRSLPGCYQDGHLKSNGSAP